MISFIIVNFNTAELTRNCISSLLANTIENEREIIVVDNASVDNSAVLLAETFGNKIKIIVNPSNLGFAAANNIGAKAASGDILFFLNSDTIIKTDIINPAKAALNSDLKLGIVAPSLLLASGHPQPFAYGRFPGILSIVINKILPPCRLKISDNLRSVDWVSGAALIIRKDIFKEIGGWDEKYFLYFEDIDLCWQVKNRGYRVAVSNKMFVTHFGGRSIERDSQRKKQYYLAQEYFFRKNHGSASALVLRLVRWPYKTLKTLKT